MVSKLPGARRHCLAAAGLALLLLLTLVLLIGLPWRAKMQEYRQTAAGWADNLGRFEEKLASRSAIEEALADQQARTGSTRPYIQGQTLGLAGANLQQLSKRLIEEAGGTLASAQIITPPSESPLQLMVNRVKMSGEMEALLKLIHQVETGEPVLFLDNLTIRGNPGRGAAQAMLEIQFDLSGYMLVRDGA